MVVTIHLANKPKGKATFEVFMPRVIAVFKNGLVLSFILFQVKDPTSGRSSNKMLVEKLKYSVIEVV